MEDKKNDTLVVQDKQKKQAITINERGLLIPKDFDDLFRLANMLASSTMVADVYRGNAANIIVAMQMGSELGLNPMQSLQSICVINGRPSVWGDAALGLVMNCGLLEDINEQTTQEIEKNKKAVCRVKRKGYSIVERSFSLDEAAKAGLTNKNGPWKSYPNRMLQMRARGFALRDAFPDVLRGIYLTEELQGLEEETAKLEQMMPAEIVEVENKNIEILQSEEVKKELKIEEKSFLTKDQKKELIEKIIEKKIPKAVMLDFLKNHFDISSFDEIEQKFFETILKFVVDYAI